MRSVLFDVDGVLLDSMPAYRRVWDNWCVQVGLDPDLVWPLTHGRRPADTIAEVAPHLCPADECRRLTDLLRAEPVALRAMPGAARLLRALPRQRWALVTSNSEAAVRQCFLRFRLPSPQLVVDGAQVSRGKPHPEGLLLAAARCGLAPSECLVVEDAPAGVAAARAARMTVVAIDSAGVGDAQAGAHQRFASVLEATPSILAWVGIPPTPRRRGSR